MKKLTLELTLEQAEALTRLLDLAMRMHLVQFSEIEMLARMHVIRNRDGKIPSNDDLQDMKTHLDNAARVLGFSDGASHGIGSNNVHDEAKHGYEIMKVVQKVLASERNPNPNFRGVHYGSLIVRLTNDPEPIATLTGK